jgi:Rieske Fe-S protein
VTESNHAPTRRAVLLGASAVGAAGVLAACGADEPASTPTPAGSATSGTPAPTGSGSAGASPTGTGTSTAADPNAINTADIPVGGGTIFGDRKLVVTQPSAGTFKAFDSTCPHQGCAVTEVSGGVIRCPCHGSQFRIADGSVAQGPANRALTAKTATVNGTTITVS